jgi:hypothetical protein
MRNATADVDLTVFAIEAGDFARGLAFDRSLFDVGAFVARHFALADADLGFQFSVFPIELQNNQGAAFDLTFAVKLVDLFAMKEKFSDAFGGRNFVARFFVGLNVGVVEKRFTVVDPRECVADVGFAGANRFNFAAFQLDAGFVAIENVKIAKRLAIKNRLGGHGSRAERGGTRRFPDL